MSTTRSSYRWKSLPGNFDKLHTYHRFDSDNVWGIPTVEPEHRVPSWLWPYGVRIRSQDGLPADGALHFFIDDYRFETVWNRPNDTLEAPLHLGFALSPMFSVYYDWPLVCQLWNTYRNRWTARFWQANGISVIPTVAWGEEISWDFCFAGLPTRSVIATSGTGVTDEARPVFEAGYREMVRRLQPELVVFYGYKISDELKALAPIKCYPTRWDGIRKTRQWLEFEQTL